MNEESVKDIDFLLAPPSYYDTTLDRDDPEMAQETLGAESEITTTKSATHCRVSELSKVDQGIAGEQEKEFLLSPPKGQDSESIEDSGSQNMIRVNLKKDRDDRRLNLKSTYLSFLSDREIKELQNDFAVSQEDTPMA